MGKIVNKETIGQYLKDGSILLIGGFLGFGTPEGLIDIIIEQDLRNLTIVCSDTSYMDKGVGRLVAGGHVKKVITSHIGTNPETGRRMNDGTMEVELCPQGTLVERIRAYGSGLGAVVTPTGVGTIVEKGKEKLTINGKEYLLEMPIKGDLALIRASISDESGNLYYKGITRNFNPIMALAADIVLVEAEEILKVGEITPEEVMTPSILVDYIIKEGV